MTLRSTDGNTGRLGEPLCRFLNNHPNVKIVYTINTEQKWGNPNEMDLAFLALDKNSSETFRHEWKNKRVNYE